MRRSTRKPAKRIRPSVSTPNAKQRIRRAAIEGLEGRVLFSTWIDTTNLAAVQKAFQDDMAATTNVDIGWTGNITTDSNGNVTGGVAGTTSAAFQAATLARSNYFREMAGVQDVTLDPTLNAQAQALALYMSAYHGANVSDNPDSPLLADGLAVDADNEKLSIFGGDLGPDAVTGFVDDGPSLEHRNLRLNPNSTTMGIGDVPDNVGIQPSTSKRDPSTFGAEDIQSFPDPNPDGPWVTRDAYVAWPNAGYVPIQVLGSYGGGPDNNTWDFQYQNADFSDATVTVTKQVNGQAPQPVRVDYENDLSGKGRLDTSGRRDSELQWRVREDDLTVGAVYHVTVASFFSTDSADPLHPTPHTIQYDVKPIDGWGSTAPVVTQDTKQRIFQVVNQNPLTQVAAAGTSATFTATPAGNANVQWQVSTDGKTFSDITNNSTATTPTLTLSNVTLSQNGSQYQAVFSSPLDTLFTATARGGGLTVQWKYSTDNGGTFNNVPSGWNVTTTTNSSSYFNPLPTSSALLVPVSADQAGYQFKAVFTNSAGNSVTTTAVTSTGAGTAPKTTTAASLQVNTLVNPINQTVLIHDAATFTAAVTPSLDPKNQKPPAVQWEVSTDGGTLYSFIPGASGLTLTVPQVNAAMSGNKYRALFIHSANDAVDFDGTWAYGEDGVNDLEPTAPATLTVTPKASSDVLIDTGGRAVGDYFADTGFSGTTKDLNTYAFGRVIDPSALTNAPPQTVLRSQRYGHDFTYTVPNLTPGAQYNVTLDFVELYFGDAQPGSRVFNVSSNGTPELTHFDVDQEAENIFGPGNGLYKAISKSFTSTADSNGVITLHFAGATDVPNNDLNAIIDGIEIRSPGPVASAPAVTTDPSEQAVAAGGTATFTAAASGTPTPAVQWQVSTDGGNSFSDITDNPTATTTALVLTNVDTPQNGYEYRAVFTNSVDSATTQPATLAINLGPPVSSVFIAAGSSTGFANFVADPDDSPYYSKGGGARSTGNNIDTSNVPNPQDLYQAGRAGSNFTYTVPNLLPGGYYNVTLDFTEFLFGSPGQRQFNVSINGTQVLTNFDIVAAAGGENIAIDKSFTAAADSYGVIQLQFTGVISAPKIDGIEITSLLINAGGPAVGGFVADSDFNGGAVLQNPNVNIDMTGLTGSNAPMSLFQTQRYGGSFSYTIPNLNPGQGYGVTLDFAELYYGDFDTGRRVFNVTLNGAPALTKFDVVAAAAGAQRAVSEYLDATADPNGNIVLQFTGIIDAAIVNGIEIGAPRLPVQLGGNNPAGISINTGGPAVGNFAGDFDYTGGRTASTKAHIDTSAVVNPAPQAVYQSERYGNQTYTIGGLTAGGTYNVRLDFAEIYFHAAGKRLFNVAINGQQVLHNFDIFATAGGIDKAIARSFKAIANQGQITITFTSVKNLAKISGIEISLFGAVSGVVFRDLNNNRVQNTGEKGVKGWTVYADLNHDGKMNADEPRAVTASDGSYKLTGVPIGKQWIRLLPQKGWVQTQPPGGAPLEELVVGAVELHNVKFGVNAITG